MRTFPIAVRTPAALGAPVHVSRGLPSLARTLEMPFEQDTQRSAPSYRTNLGDCATVVKPRTVEFCVVQYCLRAARLPRRFSVPSTVRERNAAIWSRVTLSAGE